jgi:CubicO group peptidase (beta-lactamase class C family)
MKSAGIKLIGCAILAVTCMPLFAQVSQGADVTQRIAHIESCIAYPVAIKGQSRSCHTLEDQMRALHVPGVSIAVIHHGVVEWARGFGVATLNGDAVTTDTLFQAGSISKPVSAVATLRLVQEGKLSLDTDVNKTLQSWKVPDSAVAPGAIVTLRELLTHTAGLNVHGFPGYAAGAQIPTLVQVLNGEKPANTDAVRVEDKPGTQWKYSGGGITVMQLLVQDVTKKPFAAFVRDTVLNPFGMSHSTFDQPLPNAYRAAAATPYDEQGNPIAGGPHTYPEQAAAGLWTTPSDLARFVMAIQQSSQGKDNHVLDQAMTRQMLTSGLGNWGLGIEIGGSPSNPYFDHDGSDAGFESTMVGYERSGDGVAIMTNGQNGGLLCQWILASIAQEYGWPDFQPTPRATIKLEPSELARYAGTYEFPSGDEITIAEKDDHLVTQAEGQPAFVLYPEAQNKFFTLNDLDFEFVTSDDKRSSYLVAHHDGWHTKSIATKK